MRPSKLLAGLLAAALAAVPTWAAQPQSTEQEAVAIVLSDSQITVDGQAASTDPSSPVYVGADIVYYHDGTDETYGEGEESEKHSADEAGAHTVVTLTKPGTYRLTGALSQGQIAVDLGENAKDDPSAVVTLILDNADVTCTVAPALIFYNVYECDRVWAETGAHPFEAGYAPFVDLSDAGARIILADDSVNTFTGSHVARIYQEGTTKKLHKYDGAFYSRMSMSISTETAQRGFHAGNRPEGSGTLNIIADNEGLGSELHLGIYDGVINIQAQNDGINTNEDNVSVTTVSGGTLTINAGLGEEGDGIDSNGYLVIFGGTVWTMSSDHSLDGGVDADSGIFLFNGGLLSAFGMQNDVSTNDPHFHCPYMELSFAATLKPGSVVELKDEQGGVVWSATIQKSCQTITLTTPDLALDTVYHLYVDGQLQGWSGNRFGMGGMGGFGGQRPQGMERPDDMPQPPEGFDPGQFKGERPADRPQPPEGAQWPHDRQRPDEAFGGFGGDRDFTIGDQEEGQLSTDFVLTAQTKSFSGVRAPGEDSLPFVDVDQTTQGYAAIAALYRAGIVQGDGAGHFYPGELILASHWQLMLERLAAAGVEVDSAPASGGMTRSQAAQVAAGLLEQ